MAQRVPYFDVLRVVASFAVVVIHVAAMHWKNTDANSSAWLTMNAWDAVSRFAVPVFVMISGALFLNPNRPFSMKKVLKKNIFRLVIAFVVWTVFYAIFDYVQYRSSMADTVEAILRGHYHMWFLIMIVCLYLLTPMLRKITARRDYMEYFLIVGILLTCCIPGIVDFLKGLTLITDNRTITALYGGMSHITDNIARGFSMGFVVYFVLGYYLSTINISKKNRILIYILGLLGAVFSIVYTSTVVTRSGVKWAMFDELSPGVMAWSAAVFLFARYRCKRPVGKVVGELSKLSFGVYLIHAAVLEVLVYKVGICSGGEYINTWKILVLSVMIFGISTVISWIISKIPILKKYII